MKTNTPKFKNINMTEQGLFKELGKIKKWIKDQLILSYENIEIVVIYDKKYIVQYFVIDMFDWMELKEEAYFTNQKWVSNYISNFIK